MQMTMGSKKVGLLWWDKGSGYAGLASRGFREREWKGVDSDELSLSFPLAVYEALLRTLAVEGI
jgi:hypothetical protein